MAHQNIIARVEFKKTNARARTFLVKQFDPKEEPISDFAMMKKVAEQMKGDIEKQEFLTLQLVDEGALKKQPPTVVLQNLQTVATSGIESIEYSLIPSA